MPEMYKIHKGYEWAHIFLDEGTGTFAAVTSFGNFAHIWRHHGCDSLKQFLVSLDADYFFSKTAPNRGQVFSPEKTIQGIKHWILDTRRQGDVFLTKEVARDAWNALEILEPSSDQDTFFRDLTDHLDIMEAIGSDYWEFGTNEMDSQCRAFWDKLWPEFCAQISQKATNQEPTGA